MHLQGWLPLVHLASQGCHAAIIGTHAQHTLYWRRCAFPSWLSVLLLSVACEKDRSWHLSACLKLFFTETEKRRKGLQSPRVAPSSLFPEQVPGSIFFSDSAHKVQSPTPSVVTQTSVTLGVWSRALNKPKPSLRPARPLVTGGAGFSGEC